MIPFEENYNEKLKKIANNCEIIVDEYYVMGNLNILKKIDDVFVPIGLEGTFAINFVHSRQDTHDFFMKKSYFDKIGLKFFISRDFLAWIFWRR